MSVRWHLKPEACELPYRDLATSAKLELEAECGELSRPSNAGSGATGLSHEITLTVRGAEQRLNIRYDYERRLRLMHRIIVRCVEEAA